MSRNKSKRLIVALASLALVAGAVLANPSSYETSVVQKYDIDISEENPSDSQASAQGEVAETPLASVVLEKLEVKGRAPKTGYTRDEFYSSWPTIDGCNLRQRIIRRELGSSAALASDNCTVISGDFTEPYTGAHLVFYEKSDLSKGLQIDHVVALSDAWQKGAQNLSKDERFSLATDPLNLLAVDSSANQGKSDGDAATWLPKNKSFRCQYVARQVSVKYKYSLWVTSAEKTAISDILKTCPNERAVGISI